MTPERWRTALERLYQARALNPRSAAYAAELGRHHAWLAWRSAAAPQAARAYRKRARAAYAEAIARRPTWGFAWANFAEAGLLAGAAGADTRRALGRALALAPWEPGTQQKALLAGFALWETLGEDERSQVAATLRRALRIGDEVELIIRMAVQTGREALLAGLLTDPRQRELLDRLVAQRES